MDNGTYFVLVFRHLKVMHVWVELVEEVRSLEMRVNLIIPVMAWSDDCEPTWSGIPRRPILTKHVHRRDGQHTQQGAVCRRSEAARIDSTSDSCPAQGSVDVGWLIVVYVWLIFPFDMRFLVHSPYLAQSNDQCAP